MSNPTTNPPSSIEDGQVIDAPMPKASTGLNSATSFTPHGPLVQSPRNERRGSGQSGSDGIRDDDRSRSRNEYDRSHGRYWHGHDGYRPDRDGRSRSPRRESYTDRRRQRSRSPRRDTWSQRPQSPRDRDEKAPFNVSSNHRNSSDRNRNGSFSPKQRPYEHKKAVDVSRDPRVKNWSNEPPIAITTPKRARISSSATPPNSHNQKYPMPIGPNNDRPASANCRISESQTLDKPSASSGLPDNQSGLVDVNLGEKKESVIPMTTLDQIKVANPHLMDQVSTQLLKFTEHVTNATTHTYMRGRSKDQISKREREFQILKDATERSKSTLDPQLLEEAQNRRHLSKAADEAAKAAVDRDQEQLQVLVQEISGTLITAAFTGQSQQMADLKQELENRHTSQIQKLNESIIEVKQQQSRIPKILSQLQSLKEPINVWEKEQEGRVSSVSAKVEDLLKTVSIMKQNGPDLLNRVEKIEGHMGDVYSLRMAVSKVQGLCDELAREVQVVRKDLTELSKDVKANGIDASKGESLLDVVASMETTVGKLVLRSTNFDEDLNNFEAHLNTFEEKNERISREIEKVISDIVQHRSILESLEKHCNDTEDSFVELRASFAKLERTTSDGTAQGNMNNPGEMYDLMKGKIEAQAADLHELRRTIESRNQRYSALEEKVQGISNGHGHINQNLGALKGITEGLATRMNNLTTEDVVRQMLGQIHQQNPVMANVFADLDKHRTYIMRLQQQFSQHLSQQAGPANQPMDNQIKEALSRTEELYKRLDAMKNDHYRGFTDIWSELFRLGGGGAGSSSASNPGQRGGNNPGTNTNPNPRPQ